MNIPSLSSCPTMSHDAKTNKPTEQNKTKQNPLLTVGKITTLLMHKPKTQSHNWITRLVEENHLTHFLVASVNGLRRWPRQYHTGH